MTGEAGCLGRWSQFRHVVAIASQQVPVVAGCSVRDVNLVQFQPHDNLGQSSFRAYQTITCHPGPPCSLRFINDCSLVVATMVTEGDSEWRAAVSVWTSDRGDGSGQYAIDEDGPRWAPLKDAASKPVR